MRHFLIAPLLAAVLLGLAGIARAGDPIFTPLMISLATPVQAPSPDADVGGLRLDVIYGVCANFDGLDLGLAGRATGHANGLQLAALANIVDGDGTGVQVAAVSFVKSRYVGLQVGVVNYALQAKTLQIGFYNGGGHVEGCQIGVINTAQTLFGLQIGLVNVIRDNDIPFIPLVNGYF